MTSDHTDEDGVWVPEGADRDFLDLFYEEPLHIDNLAPDRDELIDELVAHGYLHGDVDTGMLSITDLGRELLESDDEGQDEGQDDVDEGVFAAYEVSWLPDDEQADYLDTFYEQGVHVEEVPEDDEGLMAQFVEHGYLTVHGDYYVITEQGVAFLDRPRPE